MFERRIEALCVGCLAPCSLPRALVTQAIVGRRPTTFECNDELSLVGVRIARPADVPGCPCGNPGLIVRTRASGEPWSG